MVDPRRTAPQAEAKNGRPAKTIAAPAVAASLLPVVEAVPFYVLEALHLAVFFCALQWLFAGGRPLWLILTHAGVVGRHAALLWLLVRTWRETARGSLQFDQAGVRALPGMSASR